MVESVKIDKTYNFWLRCSPVIHYEERVLVEHTLLQNCHQVLSLFILGFIGEMASLGLVMKTLKLFQSCCSRSF